MTLLRLQEEIHAARINPCTFQMAAQRQSHLFDLFAVVCSMLALCANASVSRSLATLGLCEPLAPGRGAGWQPVRRDGLPRPMLPVNDVWRVQHCRNRNGRGTLVVMKKIYCAAVERLEPGSLAAFLGSGPDEFFVQLTGPEHHVLDGRHVGGCRYEFPYAVDMPGTYDVTVLLNVERYAAVDENRTDGKNTPIPTHLDDLLGTNTTIELPGSHAVTSPEKLTELRVRQISGSGMQPCSPANITKGRWLSKAASPLLAKPSVPRCDSYIACTTGRWPRPTRAQPDKLIWVPYDCSAPSYDRATIARSLTSKRLLFHGDSQMRFFVRTLLQPLMLEEELDTLVAKSHTPERRCAYIPSTRSTVCFAFDPFARALARDVKDRSTPIGTANPALRRSRRRRRQHNRKATLPSPTYAPWDVVAFHFGPWPIKSCWRVARFEAVTRAALQEVAQALDGRTRVLWFSPQMSSIPATDLHYSAKTGCRAIARLRAYAMVARSAVHDAILALQNRTAAPSIALIDASALSADVWPHSEDGLHLSRAPFQNILLATVLSHIDD